MYKNRADAGEQLAQAIKDRGYESPIIFGLTRGGVPVASKIASVLGIPLKGLVVRKLGVPFYPELGFGAIAPLGVLVVDETIVDEVGLDHNQIQSVKSQEEKELLRRLREYQIDKEVQDLSDATAIITDDGIATGTSMLAAVRYLRKFNPQKLVVAVPVCPKVVAKTIEKEVDDFICLDKEELFFGVGEFYEDFEQVSDQEVRNLLNK